MNIKQAKHVHFIGIGGIGISALAKMLFNHGKEVSGINDSNSPETLDELREKGVEISINSEVAPPIATQAEERPLPFPEDVDVYVYSAAWEGRAPTALEAARATGKPVFSYFEALGEVAKDYKVIAISGTHGKTTTTAMAAQALIAAGLSPTVIVGSLVDFNLTTRSHLPLLRQAEERPLPTNFRAGKSNLLLVEACEYKRHFLNLNPHILAVTNIELDHPDYYKDLADVEDAFAELASQSEVVLAEDSTNKYMLQVPELKVPGEHNRKNAALALAICNSLGADMQKAKDALESFVGTWRRFEYKGNTAKGAKVYDDYAHHPTAIKATLKATKSGKIIAVFEPHMFSRTKELFEDFANSFADADEVIIAPIYAAREEPIEGITAEALATAVTKQGNSAQHADTLESAVNLANELAGAEDTIIFMSAGDIFQHIPSIIKTES